MMLSVVKCSHVSTFTCVFCFQILASYEITHAITINFLSSLHRGNWHYNYGDSVITLSLLIPYIQVPYRTYQPYISIISK